MSQSNSSLFHRKFYHDVEENAKSGRVSFGDSHSLYCWVGVITEELGKLARVANKLNIAEDKNVRRQWSEEGYQRLITISAVARRMAENWESLKRNRGQ